MSESSDNEDRKLPAVSEVDSKFKKSMKKKDWCPQQKNINETEKINKSWEVLDRILQIHEC